MNREEWTHADVESYIKSSRFAKFVGCFKWVADTTQLLRLTTGDLTSMGVNKLAAPLLYQYIQEIHPSKTQGTSLICQSSTFVCTQ